MSALKSLRPAIIAIDGPAASGKSTVGYRLAELINYLFFDTGVMYRAVTWAAQLHKMDVNDHESIGKLAAHIQIDVAPPRPSDDDDRQCTVLVDGADVTWLIRATAVDQAVSIVAANPSVRQALTAQQRRIGLRYGMASGAEVGDKEGIVMVGRDIGTVVIPEAALKIYMDASPGERARRRWREQQQQGRESDFVQVLSDIYKRDSIDSERALAPLRPADDAIVIETSDLAIEDVVNQILALAQERAVSN